MMRFGKRPITRGSWGEWLKSNWMWILVILGLIAAIVVVAVVVCNNEETMKNIKGMFSGGGGNPKTKIKEADILFFMSPTCPWCQKAVQLFEKEGVLGDMTVVDITKEDGKEMAKQYGAHQKGVPSFISRRYNTGTVGFKKDLGTLVRELSPNNSQSKKQTPTKGGGGLSDLDCILFMSPTCGYCKKLKDDLEGQGLLAVIEVVDVSQPQGQQLFKQIVPDSRGVPVIYSKKTKKTCVGYKPIATIIEELS